MFYSCEKICQTLTLCELRIKSFAIETASWKDIPIFNMKSVLSIILTTLAKVTYELLFVLFARCPILLLFFELRIWRGEI